METSDVPPWRPTNNQASRQKQGNGSTLTIILLGGLFVSAISGLLYWWWYSSSTQKKQVSSNSTNDQVTIASSSSGNFTYDQYAIAEQVADSRDPNVKCPDNTEMRAMGISGTFQCLVPCAPGYESVLYQSPDLTEDSYAWYCRATCTDSTRSSKPNLCERVTYQRNVLEGP